MYSEWISVDDALPELGTGNFASSDLVIGAVDGRKKSSVLYYNRSISREKHVERWKDSHGAIVHEKVTHWMPLPEPPKEAGNEAD